MDPRFHWSLRVRLAEWQQTTLCFLEEIFQGVISVRLVTSNPGAFRKVVVIPLHGAGIAVTTRRKEKLNRLTRFGDHQMDFQPIKVSTFAGLEAPELFSR